MSAQLNVDFNKWGSSSLKDKEHQWLESRLRRGDRERFTETVNVTPSLALLLLQYNKNNRPVTKSNVKEHASRLLRGAFILHHHGMSVAKTRELNDGQHRLMAIVETDIPGMMQITFGADREEFHAIDQGRKRSASDILAIKGKTYWVLRASVAKALYYYAKPGGKPDQQMVADYAMELIGKRMDAALQEGTASHKVSGPTSIAVAHFLISINTSRPEKVESFWHGFAKGENLSGVRLKLREWLKDEEPHTLTSMNPLLRDCRRTAAIIIAWNSYVKNPKLKHFKVEWSKASELPEIL